VNGKRITTPDVPAGNGVIHVVDEVLLPPAEDAVAQSGPAKALRVIELAIDTGVELFNSGDAEGCTAVYEIAVTALLSLDEGTFSDRVREQFAAALQADESAREKAWTLRRALDAAYSEARSKLSR
jgi:hypothetical protein